MFNKFIKRIKRSARKLPDRSDFQQLKKNLTPEKAKQVFSKNWKQRLRRAFTWRKVLRAGIFIGIVGLISGATLFAWYFKDLPRPGELRNRNASESTILYDRNGKQIYDISGDVRRILLKSDEIPDIMKKASVAIEDKNFYSHIGVDIKGLARAVFSLGGQGGGSTITQQYIKNAILSPQRTLTRKAKELILAIELEAVYSKDDILTLYLNEIPFGSNIYGVEAASQTFFGHSIKDGLTLSEAATLAAIPQLPTRYSPYGNHVDLLIARKNRVLDDMVKTSAITQEEADKAKKEKPIAAKDFAQKRDNFPAPHFVMHVREQLVKKYGEEMVQRGGLRVTTTIDLPTQEKADASVKDQGAKVLPKAGASNAALVAIDPKTGQILAMVGSLDYFDRENEGNFNVATAQRQPGSSIKPLVYATLFQEKWSPSSVMWDVQTDFNGYKPNNFDGKFHGPMTIRHALGNSYNIPAVKALQLAGIPKFLEQARDLGVTTLDDKNGGLALALGAGETRLTELTGAYATFANNGERHEVSTILKIQDSRGKVLDEWNDTRKQAMKPEVAYEISHMLADVESKRNTFGRAVSLLSVSGKTVASKTGTSNDYKDALTVGYTPSIAVGVWAGNNDGKEMNRAGGSTAAAPIWHDFMTKMLADKPDEPFFRPSSISDKTVDFLSGKNPTPASGQLIQDIFAPWQAPEKDDDVHTRVKVCKSNGKLATTTTSPDEIEERTYTKVRSERPNLPAWEEPVQAWARGNNLSSEPPTEKCDITFTTPKVEITSPSRGSTVSGIFTVAADVTFPPDKAGRVEFYLDNVLQATDTSEPYSTSLDASIMNVDTHSLEVRAYSADGVMGTDVISISVGPDTAAPGDVSNVTLTPSIKGATAVWTNPPGADLANVSFYASQVEGVRGSKVGSASATGGATQTSIITGLVSGTPNYITFLITDKAGNSNTPSRQYSVTPL